jgi:hypothetical protein
MVPFFGAAENLAKAMDGGLCMAYPGFEPAVAGKMNTLSSASARRWESARRKKRIIRSSCGWALHEMLTSFFRPFLAVLAHNPVLDGGHEKRSSASDA